MPTESQFLDAARSFDEAGHEVVGIPSLVANSFGPGVTTGGDLTAEIETLIQQTSSACRGDGEALEDLAQLCRDRAAEVAAFGVEVDAYNRALSRYNVRNEAYWREFSRWDSDPTGNRHPGRAPRPPTRPARPPAYVELG